MPPALGDSMTMLAGKPINEVHLVADTAWLVAGCFNADYLLRFSQDACLVRLLHTCLPTGGRSGF